MPTGKLTGGMYVEFIIMIGGVTYTLSIITGYKLCLFAYGKWYNQHTKQVVPEAV